ncbi:hypothetical protein F5887DRAFT_917588 [Amanita rubescens]|nr:hypothetical protein F5887DRAFT_928565 [Amanita rubescens]KAF8345046.1 hypothetical protein F5887DRAFT_917588 [Amanita rubescens]
MTDNARSAKKMVMSDQLLPSELYHKPLHSMLDFHDNIPNAIRCRTHIQIEFGFVELALAYAIVFNNIADLFSFARSLHDPVMAIKRKVKTEVSIRLNLKPKRRKSLHEKRRKVSPQLLIDLGFVCHTTMDARKFNELEVFCLTNTSPKELCASDTTVHLGRYSSGIDLRPRWKSGWELGEESPFLGTVGSLSGRPYGVVNLLIMKGVILVSNPKKTRLNRDDRVLTSGRSLVRFKFDYFWAEIQVRVPLKLELASRTCHLKSVFADWLSIHATKRHKKRRTTEICP